MNEVIITSEDPAGEAAEVTEAVAEVAAVESAAKLEGVVLGEISAGLADLAASVRQVQAELDELRAGQVQVADEVEGMVDAVEAIAAVEVAEAIEEATEEAEVADIAAELAEVAEDTAEVSEVADEVVPATRRTHWFFRPGNEWRRD